MRVLEGLKGDIEGPCGEMITMDAARQVKMAITLKKSLDNDGKLLENEEEIQQLAAMTAGGIL